MSRAGDRRPEEASGSRRAIRRGILLTGFFLAGALVVARAVTLQVVEHEQWAQAAEAQHRERIELPARRGAIYDRNGVPLAMSHEMYQVSVAPGEITDRKHAIDALTNGLGRPVGQISDAVKSSRSWVVLPGRYTAEQRAAIGNVRGVYFERRFERFYPQGDAGREVIGAVTKEGRPLGGMEQELDDVLRGEPGYAVMRRDARGGTFPALSLPVVPPKDGASIYLTIDFDLQQIADAALSQAIDQTGASGGDLMIADPWTGELLASVSHRSGRSRSLTAITEPYEPGSTMKPFLVATLLAEGRASLADTVFAENGAWRDGRRVIHDTSPHEWLSLAEALEVSSNIAMAKFSRRLSPGLQYSYLRDFGFGTATGIDYPSESSGLLRRPSQWSALSSASLAIGYELTVTPLQVLTAYGALANGGVLMEPYLIREVRDPAGRVLVSREPHPLRRVVPPEVAAAVTDVLTSVVDEGTATRAALDNFTVAGKTGTSRRTDGNGYEPGAYNATFAGFFPADDPQLVIFVKLDEPQGPSYYGGLTAAPVSRETLRGILATRTPGFDLRPLLESRADAPVSASASPHGTTPAGVSAAPRPPAASVGADGTYVFELADGAPVRQAAASNRETIVPDVRGLSLRDAARRAHSAGLHVRIEGSGPVAEAEPEVGTALAAGDTVTLRGSW